MEAISTERSQVFDDESSHSHQDAQDRSMYDEDTSLGCLGNEDMHSMTQTQYGRELRKDSFSLHLNEIHVVSDICN